MINTFNTFGHTWGSISHYTSLPNAFTIANTTKDQVTMVAQCLFCEAIVIVGGPLHNKLLKENHVSERNISREECPNNVIRSNGKRIGEWLDETLEYYDSEIIIE